MKKKIFKFLALCFVFCTGLFVFAGCSNQELATNLQTQFEQLQEQLEDIQTAINNKEVLTTEDIANLETKLSAIKTAIDAQDTLSADDLSDMETILGQIKTTIEAKDYLKAEDLVDMETLLTEIKTAIVNKESINSEDLSGIESLLGEIKTAINDKITLTKNDLADIEDALKDINEKLDQEALNKKAMSLYNASIADFIFNTNGIRDNCVIDYSQSFNGETLNYEFDLYKSSSGVSMIVALWKDVWQIKYATASNVFFYTGGDKEIMTQNYQDQELVIETSLFVFQYRIQLENIKEIEKSLNSVNVLENGNYLLTFIYNDLNPYNNGNGLVKLEYELTPDGLFVGYDFNMFSAGEKDGIPQVNNVNIKIKCNYGEVDVEEILEKYAIAKAKEPQSQE